MRLEHAENFSLFAISVFFLLLFIGLTELFGIIHEFHYTIQLTFTLIYNIFSKKFSFSAK